MLDCAKTSALALRTALDDFAAMPASRHLAVLAELPDLGGQAGAFHREAGEHAERVGIDVLVCVGAQASAYLTGYDGEAHQVETPEEAASLLMRIGVPGDLALVKGPRRAALERIIAHESASAPAG